MPYLSLDAMGRAMGAIGITQVSLHTAFSTVGANEVIGGGYARQAVTFSVFDGYLVADVPPFSTSIVSFSVPVCTVNYMGFWDDANIFLGMIPNSATGVFPYTLGADLTTLTYQSSTVLNQFNQLAIWNGSSQASIGLEGSIYYSVNATDTTTQLSLTFLGAPITFAFTGGGFLQIVTPISFASPGMLDISAITISPFAVS